VKIKTGDGLLNTSMQAQITVNNLQRMPASPLYRVFHSVVKRMLQGYLPLRLGFVFGGPERMASAIGAGLNFKYASVNASYKAVGTPVFIAKRGWEIAGNVQVNLGLTVDSDKDGIDDKEDNCPDNPEDKDGFQDDDGCPEDDNDQDGVPDNADSCKNIPEDRDGYQDNDGCPDYDNDQDGIADSVDTCPMEPEYKDNFRVDAVALIRTMMAMVSVMKIKCPALAEISICLRH
jgi:hypothetical protein